MNIEVGWHGITGPKRNEESLYIAPSDHVRIIKLVSVQEHVNINCSVMP